MLEGILRKILLQQALQRRCEVQLAYVIGVAKPVSILVNTFDTNSIPDDEIIKLVVKHFPLKPSDIIHDLKLKRPIYQKTAAYGHFGREDSDFTWEATDKAEVLRKEAEAIRKN
jgi:S-adenosylmethionine synthetase